MTDDVTEQKNEQKQEVDNTKEQETVENSGNDIQEKIKISDLMENNGVTAEDFQTVYEKNPEIIYAIGGGETCKKLANSADKVVTKYKRKGIPSTGKCLPGVRNIYYKAGVDSLSSSVARNAIIESRMPYQKTNGGGNGYIALEASGDYLTIAIENSAYGKQKNSHENKEMNEMVKNVSPGITVTIDSISDRKVRLETGNNRGGLYGHIAVKRNDGCWGCDFKQETINFARYGKYARICIPKDAEVSAEYAKMLIEAANERPHDTKFIQRPSENQKIEIPDIKDMLPLDLMSTWGTNALNSDAKIHQKLQEKDESNTITDNKAKTENTPVEKVPGTKDAGSDKKSSVMTPIALRYMKNNGNSI